MGETERRRNRQIAFNEAHGITPKGVVKRIKDLIDGVYSEKAGQEADRLASAAQARAEADAMSEKDLGREIKRLEKLMIEHARNLEFEQAARVRDQLGALKARVLGAPGVDQVA
jgi:excinuclease ABC subunit B